MRLEINNTEGKIQSWLHEAMCSYKGRACSPSGCRQKGWEQLLGGHACLAAYFEKAAYELPSGSCWERKHQLKGIMSFSHTLALSGVLGWKRPLFLCVLLCPFSLWIQTGNFFSLNAQAPAMWAEVAPWLWNYFLCLHWFKQISLNHLM